MFVMVYRGWGAILVLLIPLVCFTVTWFSVGLAMNDASYFPNHRWPKALASLGTALVLWPIGRRLNKPRPEEL